MIFAAFDVNFIKLFGSCLLIPPPDFLLHEKIDRWRKCAQISRTASGFRYLDVDRLGWVDRQRSALRCRSVKADAPLRQCVSDATRSGGLHTATNPPFNHDHDRAGHVAASVRPRPPYGRGSALALHGAVRRNDRRVGARCRRGVVRSRSRLRDPVGIRPENHDPPPSRCGIRETRSGCDRLRGSMVRPTLWTTGYSL